MSLKRFWTPVQCLRRGRHKTVNTVYNRDGVLVTLAQDIVDGWKGYVKDLLNLTLWLVGRAGDLGAGFPISRAEVANIDKKTRGIMGVDEIHLQFLML